MDAKDAFDLIESAGGDTAFAKLLGLTSLPGYRQRVNNWKRRGIPPRVILDHQVIIEALRRQMPASRRKRAA